jgi:hypothetical protein
MNQRYTFLFLLVLVLFCSLIECGCGPQPPIKVRELHPVIPGDNPSDYDVYRVVSVKKDVNQKELADLMRYFNEFYLDENRVLIYVFNDPGSVQLGISEALVATFYKDKENNVVKQNILLNQPK